MRSLSPHLWQRARDDMQCNQANALNNHNSMCAFCMRLSASPPQSPAHSQKAQHQIAHQGRHYYQCQVAVLPAQVNIQSNRQLDMLRLLLSEEVLVLQLTAG